MSRSFVYQVTLNGGDVTEIALDNIAAADLPGGSIVNSVTNSDGSLTISPTTGAVVASLNVGHANTWTANQTIDASHTLTLAGLTAQSVLFAGTGGLISQDNARLKWDDTNYIFYVGSTLEVFDPISSGLFVMRANTSQPTLELHIGSGGFASILQYFTPAGAIFAQVMGNWASGLYLRTDTGYPIFFGPGGSPDLVQFYTTPQVVSVVTASTSCMALALQGLASQTATLVQLQGVSSTSTVRAQAEIDTAWADSTDATRKARFLLRAWDTASREVVRGEASGTAAMIGFLGASAVVRQTVSGTRQGNAALASALTGLANEGLITDSSTAGPSAILADGSVAFTAAQSMGGFNLTNLADPVNLQDAVTLNYLNQNIVVKKECQAATVVALAANTYANGSSGVGATITLTVAAVLVLDGYTPALNDRILVKNETASHNGIYYLSTVGVLGVTQAVLTRTLDFDQAADGIDGAFVFVQNGTVNASTGWLCTTYGSITFGTTAINWTQDTGSGTYTGTAPIAVSSSNVVSIDLSTLTAADVALTDAVAEYNAAATANRKVTVDRVGGFLNPLLCGGRLTLTTGVWQTVSDVTAAGTLYFTPGQTTGMGHTRVALYDGTRWRLYTFAEVSLALTATNGKNYDVWLYDNSGTLTLETLVWTSDSARGTALAVQDGVLVKSGDATRRYLGTFRANATNQTEDSAANRLVANAYNQVLRPCLSNVTTDESTSSASFVDLTTKDQVTFVCGINLDLIFRYSAYTYNSTGGAGELDDSQFNLDASLVGPIGTQKMTQATTNYFQPIIYRPANVGAGFHTLKVQHRLQTGTGPAHWTSLRTVEVMGLWT